MPAINMVVEDDLSRAVLERLIRHFHKEPGRCFPESRRSGSRYVNKQIVSFNKAAHINPYIVLRDLDQCACAPSLIRKLLPVPSHPNLIFRVAVREVESWIMADRDHFAVFAGIAKAKLPFDMDSLTDPKEFLINLTRNSRKKEIRSSIVPRLGSTARVGPAYNSTLIQFVLNYWDIEAAVQHSASLQKAYAALKNFLQDW